jgi:hypothetical protein
MPHVFNASRNKFEQVHAFDVPQMTTKGKGACQKRHRNTEYIKCLMQHEDEATKRTELRAQRRAALGK